MMAAGPDAKRPPHIVLLTTGFLPLFLLIFFFGIGVAAMLTAAARTAWELAAALLDGGDVISRCLEARIRPESFYDSKHGIVYERLLDLYNRQVPIDVSVVAEELKTSLKTPASAIAVVRLSAVETLPSREARNSTGPG